MLVVLVVCMHLLDAVHGAEILKLAFASCVSLAPAADGYCGEGLSGPHESTDVASLPPGRGKELDVAYCLSTVQTHPKSALLEVMHTDAQSDSEATKWPLFNQISP